MRKLLLLLAMSTLALPALAAEPHPFNVHDLVTMKRISDPQPSPKGDRVAFVLRTTDLAANRGRYDLWMVNADGGGLVQLTNDPASDDSPRWAPDGQSLYFLSSRSGSNQVWKLPMGAKGPGEPVQVTRLPLDVSNLIVSPDGSRLAFSLEVYVDCPTVACTRERMDAKGKKGTASGQLYQGGVGFFRHWDTWSAGMRNHLFTLPSSGQGDPVDVSRGMAADVPSRPFGGSEEFTFSPDGRTVVFTARVAGREEPWSTNFDLYSVPADGSAAPRNLTQANLAWDTQPAFSPDGKTLAYLAMTRPGFESDRFHVRVRDLATGQDREIAAPWDRSPDGIVFSKDGRTLYATANDVGQSPLFAIDVASGKVTRLVAEGHARDPKPAGDRIVYGLDTLTSPVELFTVGRDGGKPTQITHVNREALAGVGMTAPEHFSFPGANGDTVWGWVAKPVGFQPGKKYPLAFLIHGGPQNSFDNEFHYRWNPQPYAGAGYGVVMIDFHGSPGYGQAFTDSISRDWGGQAAGRPPEGAGGGDPAQPMDRRRPGLRPGGLLRRLHDQLDPGELAGPLQVPGGPRRHLRSANDVLQHRGALVSGMGDGRPVLAEPRGVREGQSGELRRSLEDADAGGPQRPRLPHPGNPGDRGFQHPPAQGDPQPVPLLPGREPLGAQARQQHPLARHRAGLARPLAEAGGEVTAR